MITVAVNGYKSYIGKNFYRYYNKKYKIIHYKEDINDIDKFKLFTNKKSFDYFIHLAGLSRLKCNLKKKAKHLAKHMWERIANGRNTCDLKKSSKSLAVEQMLRHSQVGIHNGIES